MNKGLSLLAALALLLAACAAPAAEATAPAVAESTALSFTPVAATATVQPSEAGETAITPNVTSTSAAAPADIDAVVQAEMRGSFDFFWQQANSQPGSLGFGLIRDRYPGSEGIASIASTGFGLTALAVGVEKRYITLEEGQQRATGTLDTLLAMPREEGFFYHFVSMETGQRAWDSEVSNIDTAILLMGALSAGEYFGGEVEQKAQQLYDGVNWPWFLDPNRNMFYMAYSPEDGFAGHWDFYAEQLMMYVLAAGSDTHPTDHLPYYAFTRHAASYGEGQPFYHSWFGSIFTYQFSHAWIDFRGYIDTKDTDWFQNSVDASLAQYQFAVDNDDEYTTLGPLAWGLTASDGPGGYNGLYGAPPSGFDNKAHRVDDTVPPAGAIGSIIFTPEQVLPTLQNYASIAELQSEYGFKDAYNLTEDWFASDVIGIDKGITLLMLANYENDLVYRITMENDNLLKGLERLRLTRVQP